MTNFLIAFTAWWHRLGGAMTGDAPHPYATEYPWPYGCWCDKPPDHPVHWSAERALSALREAER